jgi:hypothetical protein
MNKTQNELLTKLETQMLSCVLFIVCFSRKGEMRI